MSYDDALEIFGELGGILTGLKGAFVYRGSIPFASIPATLTESMAGYVYNINEDFTTDNRFVEGADKKQKAGTNIDVVDLSTYSEVTPVGSENPKTEGWYELVDGKYVLTEDSTVDAEKTYYAKNVNVKLEVSGSFINVDEIEAAIKAIQDMVAGVFDPEKDYKTGDVVVHDKKLKRFDANYTAFSEVTPAGTENPKAEGWYERSGSGTDVDPYVYTKTEDETIDVSKTYYKVNGAETASWTQVTVVDLIADAEPDSFTSQQKQNIINLLN